MSGTILRALFIVVFAVTGFLLGREAYEHLISLHVASQAWLLVLTVAVPVAGALAGLFLAPWAQSVFEVELDAVERGLERLSAAELAGGAAGLLTGLAVAFLVKGVLFESVAGAGVAGAIVSGALSLLAGIFAAFLGARVGAKFRLGRASAAVAGPAAAATAAVAAPPAAATAAKLIDTSAIVDGRIAEIVASGFLDGPFVLPRFVLRELQTIADSADPAKRTRGRRGLEVLARLGELAPLEIDDADYPAVAGVDAKLVKLALERGAKLVTNDYALNRVAHVEGVAVLNVNELAGAIAPVVLPGEELHVAIVRDGKEAHQGVGYLDDGTMIVVENGRRHIGEEADVQVTSVLQTASGRMIFAKLKRAGAPA